MDDIPTTFPKNLDLNSPAHLAPDDARLTAYALGQLDGDDLADGRAAVEAALAGDAALAGEVDAIRAMAVGLTAALAAEADTTTVAGLTDVQQADVRRAAERRNRTLEIKLPRWWPVGPSRTAYLLRSSLAAVAILLVVVLPLGYATGMLLTSPRGMGALSQNVDRKARMSSEAIDSLRAMTGDASNSAGAAAVVPGASFSADAAAPLAEAPAIAAAPNGRSSVRQSAAPTAEHRAMEIAPESDGLYDMAAAPEDRSSQPIPNLPPDLHATAVAPMRYPTPEPYPPYPPNGEGYNNVVDNPFQRVTDAPLSTFGVDVDTASYANARRFLTGGQLPPAEAVRIEELINYFPYDYEPPRTRDEMPFAVDVAAHPAPWAPEHRLVRVALKGREIESDRRPTANLVFLIDVSGSMSDPNKLPLVQQSMTDMVEQLRRDDRVAIVTYAGEAGIALDSTPGSERGAIIEGIRRLNAGGSTNGAAGILTAYEIARRNFMPGGVNRVILATDGDFNVGVTSDDQLVQVIQAEARTGVFLTVLGFGMGNLQDGKLEQLADKGNGHYAYIDGEREAQKALVDELDATLVTIAKDVKVQVEFNPAQVAGYRLIGYENRAMAAEDFADDTKDGGEIGAGHTVTALYEVVPVDQELPGADGVPLRYQGRSDDDTTRDAPPARGVSGELLVVKLRWKAPDGSASTERDVPFVDRGEGARGADQDWRFAASVAAFGMLLRRSPYSGDADWRMVLDLAEGGLGRDEGGWRREFIDLVRHAQTLSGGDR